MLPVVAVSLPNKGIVHVRLSLAFYVEILSLILYDIVLLTSNAFTEQVLCD